MLNKQNYIMKFLLFIVISTTFLFNSFSQVNGYFGKKNFIDFGIDIHMPIVYNFNTQSESYSYNFINKDGKMPILNTGFHLSYSKVITRNMALGIEGVFSSFKIAPFNQNDYYYTNLNTELLGVRKSTIIPKIEFSYSDALLPIGLSNQIGFGFNSYNAVERDYSGNVYYYDEMNYNTELTPVTKDNLYDFKNGNSIKGYTILYKLTMRIPINKYILYHFGFRYTFNFVPNFNLFMPNNSIVEPHDYILSNEDFRFSIKRKENRSLVMFETGLTFAF